MHRSRDDLGWEIAPNRIGYSRLQSHWMMPMFLASVSIHVAFCLYALPVNLS